MKTSFWSIAALSFALSAPFSNQYSQEKRAKGIIIYRASQYDKDEVAISKEYQEIEPHRAVINFTGMDGNREAIEAKRYVTHIAYPDLKYATLRYPKEIEAFKEIGRKMMEATTKYPSSAGILAPQIEEMKVIANKLNQGVYLVGGQWENSSPPSHRAATPSSLPEPKEGYRSFILNGNEIVGKALRSSPIRIVVMTSTGIKDVLISEQTDEIKREFKYDPDLAREFKATQEKLAKQEAEANREFQILQQKLKQARNFRAIVSQVAFSDGIIITDLKDTTVPLSITFRNGDERKFCRYGITVQDEPLVLVGASKVGVADDFEIGFKGIVTDKTISTMDASGVEKTFGIVEYVAPITDEDPPVWIENPTVAVDKPYLNALVGDVEQARSKGWPPLKNKPFVTAPWSTKPLRPQPDSADETSAAKAILSPIERDILANRYAPDFSDYLKATILKTSLEEGIFVSGLGVYGYEAEYGKIDDGYHYLPKRSNHVFLLTGLPKTGLRDGMQIAFDAVSRGETFSYLTPSGTTKTVRVLRFRSRVAKAPRGYSIVGNSAN